MRFKKGTKVEVLTLKEGPSASWRCAEIIGISSRRYTVRYEGDIELSGKGMVEGVSQRSIRPCPPPVDVLQDWLPGDVVEVFQNFCWKMATILKVSGRNHVLVRLLGSPVEYKANKYDVRARLCWHNDEWNLIGKASNKCDDFRFRLPSPRNDNNEPRRLVTILNGRRKCGTEFTGNTNIVLESQAMRSKTVKRKRSHSRPSQKKIRLGNRESSWNQLNAAQQPQLPEKVENIASSRGVLHEKRMHPSLIDNINGYSEMIMEREKTDGVVGYSHSICLDSSDDVSVSSSVGSCSVYRNSSPKLHHLFSAVQYEGNDSESSDAESFCQLRFEEGDPLLPAVDLIDEIHRLELHAYRCTIGALYASGPLSWEQELLLTNLRHSLHISNDEHLAEIRNLVSSRICIPTS